MKNMSRRNFLKICAAAGLSATTFGNIAYANERENCVQFTEDVASNMASDFIQSIFPERHLMAGNVTRLYSQEGSPFGYIVDFLSEDDLTSGYIVFDGTRNGDIYEFSIDPGVLNPVMRAISNAPRVLSESNDIEAILTGPFTYAAYAPPNKRSIRHVWQ